MLLYSLFCHSKASWKNKQKRENSLGFLPLFCQKTLCFCPWKRRNSSLFLKDSVKLNELKFQNMLQNEDSPLNNCVTLIVAGERHTVSHLWNKFSADMQDVPAKIPFANSTRTRTYPTKIGRPTWFLLSFPLSSSFWS